MKRISREWDEVKKQLTREEKKLVTKAALDRSEVISFCNLQTQSIAMFKAGIAYSIKYLNNHQS